MTHCIQFLMIGVLVLPVLPGCATQPQESQATASEKSVIEESESTVVDASALECPPGTTEWCVRRFRHERCSCVDKARGRGMMEKMPNPDYRKPR